MLLAENAVVGLQRSLRARTGEEGTQLPVQGANEVVNVGTLATARKLLERMPFGAHQKLLHHIHVEQRIQR